MQGSCARGCQLRAPLHRSPLSFSASLAQARTANILPMLLLNATPHLVWIKLWVGLGGQGGQPPHQGEEKGVPHRKEHNRHAPVLVQPERLPLHALSSVWQWREGVRMGWAPHLAFA